MYEFPFLKFYAGRDTLGFNYPNLSKFIPAGRERYLSDARTRLDPARDILQPHGVIAGVSWALSRDSDPRITLRGSVAASGAKNTSAPVGYEVGKDNFVLKQIEDILLPEWQIVENYHKQ